MIFRESEDLIFMSSTIFFVKKLQAVRANVEILNGYSVFFCFLVEVFHMCSRVWTGIKKSIEIGVCSMC